VCLCSFLPGKPIPNDQIDEILGHLDGASKRVQSFVKHIASQMIEDSGVEYRHFAIDPKTHRLTHTIASLGEEAARRALDSAGKKPGEIELILLSSPCYDYATPPTSTLLQERLGIECCAEDRDSL
jgi:3-oxoacyl-[acyl-carrier-protein] synthase-3